MAFNLQELIDFLILCLFFFFGNYVSRRLLILVLTPITSGDIISFNETNGPFIYVLVSFL